MPSMRTKALMPARLARFQNSVGFLPQPGFPPVNSVFALTLRKNRACN